MWAVPSGLDNPGLAKPTCGLQLLLPFLFPCDISKAILSFAPCDCCFRCRNTICAKSIYETMSLNSTTATTTTTPVETTTDHLGATAATGAGAPATRVVESPAAEAAVYSRSLGAAQPSGGQPLDQRPIGPPGESTTIELPRGVPSGRCIQPGFDELSCI